MEYLFFYKLAEIVDIVHNHASENFLLMLDDFIFYEISVCF